MTALPDLAEIKRRWLDTPPEPDPDPIVRKFNERKLPANAILRQIYAEYLVAGDPKAALESRIAEAEADLRAARARAFEVRVSNERRVNASTPLPTIEQAAELVASERRAELIKELVEIWQRQLLSAERTRQEAVKRWEGARESWGRALYEMTGDRSMLSGESILIGEWKHPDRHTIGGLAQTLANLER